MDLGLTDKVVVVTGAARGVGLATAKLFHAEGARVFSVDRSFDDDYPLADANRDRHRYATVDVSTEAGATSVVRLAREAFGTVDIIVLNAARHSAQSVASLTADELDLTYRTNLLGAAFALREFATALPAGGAVVVVGSTATKSVQKNEFAYRSSKFGLRALTESAAVEFAHADVRVNMVTPGAIQTGFAKYGPGVLERLTDEIPLGRTATPEEVATCIAFVASPACGYMTGSELLVDGGLSMRSLRLGD